MWDFVMLGLGVVMFLICLGYIKFCAWLHDPQEGESGAVESREIRR